MKPKPAKTKPQARTRTAPPHGATPTKKACTESMSSARPTVPTTANDADTSDGESGVEMQVEIKDRSGEKCAEEVAGEENFVRGSKTIPPRPVLPLPKRPAPVPKHKLDASEREELEALRLEVATLWEENEELHVCTERYSDTLLHARQHAWAQEAEGLLVSNKAFTSAHSWCTLELEIAELFN